MNTHTHTQISEEVITVSVNIGVIMAGLPASSQSLVGDHRPIVVVGV